MTSFRSSSPCYALFAASAIVLSAAAVLWGSRSHDIVDSASTDPQASNGGSGPVNGAEGQRFIADSRAMRLLERSFNADNKLTYSAEYSTTAMYGAEKIESRAKLMRAPHRLSITYISGHCEGLQTGFNERWFWRRDGNASMQPYAEVAKRPDEMAARRLSLLQLNYGARLLPSAVFNRRPCAVVELRRTNPLPGALGPYKRLWIDRATGLTVRTDTYNHQGRLVMRSVLTNLKVGEAVKPDSFVKPEAMAKRASEENWMFEEMNGNRRQVATEVGIAPPEVSQLPAGFVFDSVGVHRFDNTKKPTAALARYCDGLNVLTVFVLDKSASGRSAGKGTCDFGAATMAMRTLPDGKVLLAVGDLPEPLLQDVLEHTSIPTNTARATLRLRQPSAVLAAG